MNAISVGPFVFDAVRLTAIGAILLFSVAVSLLSRRGKTGTEAWVNLAILIWILGARVGFVLLHPEDFVRAPLDVIKLWQGGFSAPAGWIAGGAVLLVALVRGRQAVIPPLLIAAAVAGGSHWAVSAALSRPDMALPTMNLLALNGAEVELAGRDRVVVVNLWATWCPPCRREMPMMTDLAAEMPEVDFVFANQGESGRQIFAFLEAENLPQSGMLRDPEGQLMDRLGAVGLPSTLVFDDRGALVRAHTGEISRAALRAMIETAKGRL